MVRHTEADDEAKFETVTDAADVEVGDTIDVSGPDWLPKSNLTVDEVGADYDHPYDGVMVTASLDRKNARDYSFLIADSGFVKTSDSSGRMNTGVRMKVEVDDTDDRFAYDGEDDDIEAEARDVLGDEHVDDVLASYDDRYDAIADLADAVVDEDTTDDVAGEGDAVVIRTDDGIIHATVDEVVESDRPDDGARLGGTLDADDPSVHYVDYHHTDE